MFAQRGQQIHVRMKDLRVVSATVTSGAVANTAKIKNATSLLVAWRSIDLRRLFRSI